MQNKKVWGGVLALTFAAANLAFAADAANTESKTKTGAISWVGGNNFKFKVDGDAQCGTNLGCVGLWHDESLRSREDTKVGQKVECAPIKNIKAPRKAAYMAQEVHRTQGDTHKAAKGIKVPKGAFDCKAI